jgi:predicted ArsR family transcriptional regulator
MTATEEYARVLSSSSRVEILKLLNTRTLSVDEIAAEFDLQPITVRHHLRQLSEMGLIEAYEKREGSVGRPKVHYKATKKTEVFSFPRRYYQRLSKFLIDGVRTLVGKKRMTGFLREVGQQMAKNDAKELERNHNVREWTLNDFQNVFIEKFLKESGAQPEIIEVKENRITYRLHNCFFYELASSMPEIMCDILHEGYHKGLSNEMGGPVIDRHTCMGHGDDYCEHVCEFGKAE